MTDKKEYKNNFDLQGQCPNCGSDGIEYGETELEGEDICYRFSCPVCGATGGEWYFLEFSEITVDGEEEPVDLADLEEDYKKLLKI